MFSNDDLNCPCGRFSIDSSQPQVCTGARSLDNGLTTDTTALAEGVTFHLSHEVALIRCRAYHTALFNTVRQVLVALSSRHCLRHEVLHRVSSALSPHSRRGL